MKKIALILFIITSFTALEAQILKPVKWTSKLEKISENEYNIVLNGTIEADWHLYSQFTPDGGPLPLVLLFTNQKSNYNLIGRAIESLYIKKFNDVFEVDEYYFEKTVTITQKIKLLNLKNTKVELRAEYHLLMLTQRVKYPQWVRCTKKKLLLMPMP